MEWLVNGTYTFEPQHPPLARVLGALGPYYQARFQGRNPLPRVTLSPEQKAAGDAEMWGDGNLILQNGNNYAPTLAWARFGIVPFFLLACWVVWAWACWSHGEAAALAAVFLLTTLPSILAHASIATTDMAAAACCSAALYSFVRWLEAPSLRRSLLAGFFLSTAVLTKFSSLVFLPVGFSAVIAFRLLLTPSRDRFFQSCVRYVKFALVGLAAAAFLVWSGYRFSSEPIVSRESRPHALVTRAFGRSPLLQDLATRVVEAPIPAPEFFRGVVWVYHHNEAGHPSYLLGRFGRKGWWYFFLVAILVKTPLPFLILVLIGSWMLLRHPKLDQWKTSSALIPALAIFATAMASTINLGIRHILCVYPLLAIVAGTAVTSLLGKNSRGIRAGATLLLVWQFCSSVFAHPYYLGYFNELAYRRPESVLAGSDLDWGQDLGILSRRLADLHVKDISLKYYGSADVSKHGLPSIHSLSPLTPCLGWVAVSLSTLKIEAHQTPNPPHAFEWLSSYRPKERVGTSFLLYYIPSVGPNHQTIAHVRQPYSQ
jgi:4-amino-4-deoxy-L-arabinose transferase-like glycosyltransferase